MGETRFTKGPWGIERRDDEMGGIDYVIYSSGDVCTLHEQARPRSALKSARADAALIAAAPELYEACEKALEVSIDLNSVGDGLDAETEAKLRAALAKARGEKP